MLRAGGGAGMGGRWLSLRGTATGASILVKFNRPAGDHTVQYWISKKIRLSVVEFA